MARGKHANQAKGRRIEELENEIDELKIELTVSRSNAKTLLDENTRLRARDNSAVLNKARDLADEEIIAVRAVAAENLDAEREDTAKLLMFLVDVIAKVNKGEIGPGQMPGELPGLLHHFSERPGELYALAVGAHEADADPDVAVMATRRNRRAGVNAYRAEASRRREHGLDDDPSYAVLGDPNAWLSRTAGWEDHVRH